MNMTCEVIGCNQPRTPTSVDRSVPFKIHERPKGKLIIGWDSIYGKYCYFHDKISKGLIAGIIPKK